MGKTSLFATEGETCAGRGLCPAVASASEGECTPADLPLCPAHLHGPAWYILDIEYGFGLKSNQRYFHLIGVEIQIQNRKGDFYEDESCMEGARFLTLRIIFWRSTHET